MSMKCVTGKLRRGVAAAAVVSIAAGLAFGPVSAAITMVDTLVAKPAAAFEKGVEFPLLGLHDSKPTFIAARVFKWTQRPDDAFVLEPTEDFTVYPQLLRMGADSRKSVTIKATRPLPADAEGHYRIVLREFDRADGTDAPPEESGAAMAMVAKPQASIPMVVRGPATLKSAPLQVAGVRDTPPPKNPMAGAEMPGSLLTLYNPGQVYERIVAIAKNEQVGPGNQVLTYVLPGQRIDVGMKGLKSGDRLTVQYVIGPDAKVDWTAKTDDRKTVSFVVP